VAALDAVHANVVCQFDGGAQAAQCGNVGTANALEAFGAELDVVPPFGGDGAPQAVDDFVTDIQEASALGGLQPLVRAGRIHVAAQVGDVEAHHSRNVGAIDSREDSFRARQRGEFFRG
jgi:hypothetical protein